MKLSSCEISVIHSGYLVFIAFLQFLIVSVSGTDDSSVSTSNSVGGGGASTLQNVDHVIDYFHTLKRSQDEIFRKAWDTNRIDWLIKAVEERDHEEYKFRLKFTRKVHTLENKVLYAEQTFAQKVEEVVQKKVDETLERLRYQYQVVSGTHAPSNSHGGGNGAASSQIQHQNYQPFISSQNRYQHHPHQYHRQAPYQNNWGFYEHPITQKRVRDTTYGYEPPTRDLPVISLVATGPASAPSSGSVRTSDVKGNSISGPLGTNSDGARERDDALSTKFIDEAQKKFESYDLTLESLRANVTTLEKEIARHSHYQYQAKESDNDEIHKILSENSREVNNLHKRHQELMDTIEYFTVEMEKTAGKREQAVNESLKELSSELKKQVIAVKAYIKRQIQNITVAGQAPDKMKCAQTLLDELIAQLSKPRNNHNALVQTDLIADQADRDEDNNGDVILHGSGAQTIENLTKEMQMQRQEILGLKSDMGRLNNSQIVLRRTVDEETLKRKVRPRDCAEIKLLCNVSSGVYYIFPRMNDVSEEVYCDMETDGGGWTVILRRGESINVTVGESREEFSKSWDDYVRGFGSFNSDFWLGLSNIAAVAQLGIQQLRIDMTNWDDETRHATYHYFKISNESELYKINVSGYSGTAGDSLTRHNGMSFSTPDRDNDSDPRRHCAKTYSSGWWYYACFESNLTGRYHAKTNTSETPEFGSGIIWQHWTGNGYSLKHVEMKIRNTFIGNNQYINSV